MAAKKTAIEKLWYKTELSDDDAAAFVEQRFEGMKLGRSKLASAMQANLNLRDRGIDDFKNGITPAVWKQPYRPTTGMQLNQAWKDELRENRPELTIKAIEPEDRFANEHAIGMREAIRHEEIENQSKMIQTKVESDAVDFGMGICFDGYDYHKKGIVSYHVPLKNFFWDELALDISEARDAIWRDEISLFEFWRIWGEKVSAMGMTIESFATNAGDTENSVRSVAEMNDEELNKKVVKIYDYYNNAKKWHFVVANGIVLVNEEYSFSALPFQVKYFLKNPDSFVGISNLQISYADIAAMQQLITIAFESAKNSMARVYFVDGDSGLEKNLRIEPNKIIPIKSNGKNLSEMVQSFSFGGVSNDFFGMYQLFQDALTISSQQDQRSLQANPNQLATQTKAKRDSFQKRARSIIAFNMASYGVRRMQHLIELLKVHLEEAGEKTYAIDGYVVLGGNSGKPIFKKSAGVKSKWTAKQENLEGKKFLVEVVEKEEMKISKEEELSNLLRFFEVIQGLGAINPQVLLDVDLNGMLEIFAEKFGVDKMRILKSSNIYAEDAVETELKKMMMGRKVSLTENLEEKEIMKRIESAQKLKIEKGDTLDSSVNELLDDYIHNLFQRMQ